MDKLPKARWSILLPIVAVLITTILLLSAARGSRRHSSLDYMPYGVIAAWALNGPAFFPTPFRSPIGVPFGDRLYSVFIGWLCFGAYLDWRKKHPSEPFLASRLTRLLVFGTLTLALTVHRPDTDPFENARSRRAIRLRRSYGVGLDRHVFRLEEK